MTQEQYERIKPLESILKSAVNSNYIRLMDRKIQSDFVSLCQELNIYVNTNCPSCMLAAAIRLGRMYLSYVPEIKLDDVGDSQAGLDDKTILPTSPESPVSPDSSDSVNGQSGQKVSGQKPKKQKAKSTKKK